MVTRRGSAVSAFGGAVRRSVTPQAQRYTSRTRDTIRPTSP